MSGERMTTTTDAFYQKNCESFLYSNANSLFSVRDSIWTYNCPCPSPQHYNENHVCRFKRSAAESITLDSKTSRILRDEYDALALFFSQRPSNLHLSTTTTEATVVAAATTATTPEEAPYTKYGHFMDFMEEKGFVVRSRQCYHANTCRTQGCTFGHSVEEMISVFREEQVRWFYSEAVIKSQTYAPHTKEMAVTSTKKMRCPAISCMRQEPDITTRLMLYTGYDSYLIYPYITIKCNICRRLINAPIYK